MDLREGTPLAMLRQMAVHLDADLIEDFGASKLKLDNDRGKGTISLHEVFPGLTAWIYDINFTEDVEIDLKFSDDRPYYFGYHVSGYQKTKFPEDEVFKKISQGQNFIIAGEPGTEATFVIPAGIDYKSCFIIVYPHLLGKMDTFVKRKLKEHLAEIMTSLSEDVIYRYFGNFDHRTGTYADIVVNSKRTDLVGRLLTEAAILNMLASQIQAHDHDKVTEKLQPELSKLELEKINELGDYIREHLEDRLTISHYCRHIGLSPKKLQAGIRFLFGYSVNDYATNIRLGVARELINATDMSISQICYKVGYVSRSHFSKTFKKRYGMLPTAYKNSFKKEDLFFEVTYRSMAATNIGDRDIQQILETSRANNAKHKITGSLIYHRKVFFQLIEGNKADVLKLYETIKRDSRHFDIATMWQGVKPSRDFGEWDMAMLADGMLSVPSQGDTLELDLGHLMGDIDERSLASKNLWRKVRNIIKTKPS